MAKSLAVGDEAPNFDLASTEDVVLMLCDETARMAQVLYFFADPKDDGVRRDLAALAAAGDGLKTSGVCILGISPTKVDDLKALQREVGVPFPLLFDDRGFAVDYGLEAVDDESAPAPALVVVDRRQKVIWIANPVGSVDAALAEVATVVKGLPSPASNYPRSIVNRVVDRWVN